MSLNYFSFSSYRTGERCYRRKIIVSAKQLKKSECSCYLTALPPTLQTNTLVIYSTASVTVMGTTLSIHRHSVDYPWKAWDSFNTFFLETSLQASLTYNQGRKAFRLPKSCHIHSSIIVYTGGISFQVTLRILESGFKQDRPLWTEVTINILESK